MLLMSMESLDGEISARKGIEREGRVQYCFYVISTRTLKA